MRLSVTMFLVALAGLIFGAHLIGLWCVGLAVMADSVAVGVFALLRDDGSGKVGHPVSGATEEQRFIAAVVDEKRSA